MGGPDRLWLILLVLAVFASPFFLLGKAVQARQRELELARQRSKGLATRVAAALELRIASPEEQQSERGWLLSGVLHGRMVQLDVGERSAVLKLGTTRGHPTPWDLVRESMLRNPGGMVNDPDDPYLPLDASIAGEGLFVRGPDARELAAELPERVRDLLRSDPTTSVNGGWFEASWSAPAALTNTRDVSVALAEWARNLVDTFAPVDVVSL